MYGVNYLVRVGIIRFIIELVMCMPCWVLRSDSQTILRWS